MRSDGRQRGAAARIREILGAPLARPRKRLLFAGDAMSLKRRQRVHEFPYEHHRFVDVA